jgi:glycosyltransferase involved in cell wall biosynthesis
VVSAALASMKSIERDYVHLATGAEAFARSISQCLRDPVRAMASRHGPVLVERHTWPERADRLSQAIEASFDALEILAPLRHDREVALYCPELLDRDGNDWVPGGRQRYLLDLAGAVARTGYRPVVYQHGDAPWVRRIDNLEVRSLWRAGPVHASIASERSAAESDAAYFNQLFHTQLLSKAALYIYAPFVEAFPHALHPNIGISQGVSWDDPRATFTTGLDFWAANRGVTESLRLCDSVVASDASTSDWFRTIDHEDSKRITVLPTGVDPARFKPGTEPVGQANDTDDELEPLVVLYPRRLSERHGLYLVLEVADKLLEAYEQVQLHFVGDGDPADVAPVRALMDRWPERVYLDRLAFDQMPDAYRDADITLVPTLYGGGTNRACLEAMATGNAVIGTRIGGSTGLILDGFNGLLIEPTAEALTEALARLIQDDGLRRRLGRHARDTAKTSHIDRWRAGWHRLLTDRLPARVDADDVTQTEPRLVLIEMKKAEIGGPVLGWLLARLLEHGDLVYVFDHDERHPLRRGFGRLQWITAETAANVQPDLWIVDAALQVDEDAPTSDEAHSAAGPNCWIRGTTADPWPMSADAPVLIAEPTSDGRGTPIRTRDALEALGLTKPAEAAPTEPDENTTIVRLESTTVRQTG